MNILVLSDSHGNISNMEEAVEREKPDMILHLGDCWRDAERLAERYPDIPMEHVQSAGRGRHAAHFGAAPPQPGGGHSPSGLAGGLEPERDHRTPLGSGGL